MREYKVTGVQAYELPISVAKGGVATESVTVAVQVVEAPAAKAGGLQLTVVTVGCLVTVTAAAVALEELSWVASPSRSAALTSGPQAPWQLLTPPLLGWPVSVSEQLAKAVVVAPSAIFFFNDTATTEIYTLSLPTLFRSVEAPAAKAGGLQLTVVTVGCLVTVTAAAVALEELSWVASPS